MAVKRTDPPVSARVLIPETMVYQGELPANARPDEPSSRESTWRNATLTFATVLVVVLAGVVIFWPRSGQVAAPAASPTVDDAAADPTSSGGVTTVRHVGPPPSGVAMPTGDVAGWRQTFAEDFNSDFTARWNTYEGEPGGDPGGWWMPSHVSQRGGKLTIDAYEETTPNGRIYASGGVSNAKTFSQSHGRFEIRYRMQKGYGISYAILLWPTSNVWPPEIDIAEDNGRQRDKLWAYLHYGSDNRQMSRTTRGPDFSTWHTARLDWKPGELVYRLDGKVWATMTTANVPDNPMSIAIQTQAWECGKSYNACPNSTTPTRVAMDVDWVVAYQSVD